VKEFDIKGKIIIENDLTHQEFLNKFYVLLKAYDMHFAGESKEVNKDK
jgi:hypothetical protein